jgi:hypothetical protein
MKATFGGGDLMKKILVLIIGVCLLGFSGMAAATSFTVNSYDVVFSDSNITVTPELATPTSFSLSEGGSQTVDLFSIGIPEQWVDLADMVPSLAKVSFVFSTPAVSGDLGGVTMGMFNLEVVAWSNPLQLTFGDGGLLEIDLSNVMFLSGSSDVVDATFTLLKAPAVVPISPTVFLFGSGLMGLFGLRRR